MTKTGGYLVVLRHLSDWATAPEDILNRQYLGVFRTPAWPSSHKEEAVALERYVFDLKDPQTGLIPRLADAEWLLASLSASPRTFEIIRCAQVALCGHDRTTAEGILGYDVAGNDGPMWSIVGDFPHDIRVRPFLHMLNKNGLFDSPVNASRFLEEYVRLKLPDWDAPFAVYEVEKAPSRECESRT